MPTLPELQEDFRGFILGGPAGRLDEAVVGDRIAPAARLQIYRNHLFTTLTDALALTFPVVRRLVDERFFAYAAHRYIEAAPPARPCLFEYGDSFPAFLAGFEPCEALPYLADVARLEWAINESFHAADAPALDPQRLAAVPPERFAALRFSLHPATRLIESPFPVDRIWQANQPDSTTVAPVSLDAGPSQVLVLRRGLDVEWRSLDKPRFDFLRALAAGTDLAGAVTAAGEGLDLVGALSELLADEVFAEIHDLSTAS